MNPRILALSIACLTPPTLPVLGEPPSQPVAASIGPRIDNNTNPPMAAKNATGTLGTIERLDPALDALLPADAKLEILVDGIQWAEGPVWSGEGLFFSDVPQNTVYRWTPGKGVGVYLAPSGYTGSTPRGGEPGSNGLTLDAEGRLVLCQHGDRRVARLEKDGKSATALVERFHGKRFNSPNDLCFDATGNLYFTDPPYGLEGKDADPKKEMDRNGVYLVRRAGEVVRLNTGDIVYADGKRASLQFPNGVALSPDGKALYVCVSDPKNAVILKYAVQSDSNVADGKVFFDARPLAAKKAPGLPDGMKVDEHGNLWATGPGGVLILSPEGKHLGTIATGVPTANCGWGDDGTVLYVCANRNLCRIKTTTRGVLPGGR